MQIAGEGLWWFVLLLGVFVDECYCGQVYDVGATVLKSEDKNKDVTNDLERHVKQFVDPMLGEAKQILLKEKVDSNTGSLEEFVTRKQDASGNRAKLLRKLEKDHGVDILVLVEYFESKDLKELVKEDKLSMISKRIWETIETERDQVHSGQHVQEEGVQDKKNTVLDAIWGAVGCYRQKMKVGVYYTYYTYIPLATMKLDTEITVEIGADRQKKGAVGFMEVKDTKVNLPSLLTQLLRKVDEEECDSLQRKKWSLGEEGESSGNAGGTHTVASATLLFDAPIGRREVRGPLKSFIYYIFETMCYAFVDLVQGDAMETTPIYIKFGERWAKFWITIHP